LTSPAREGQTFAGESLLVRYANFVKLPHTVFALPFALLGLLVASREAALTWRTLGLVVLAFTCARFVALGFNRIADRELDARNSRTRARELPSGRLTLRQAWNAVGVAAAVTVTDALLAFPVAFYMAKVASRRGKALLVVAVLLPLWSSYLVKIYSWKAVLGTNGVMNYVLQKIGLISHPVGFLLYDTKAVAIALTSALPPGH